MSQIIWLSSGIGGCFSPMMVIASVDFDNFKQAEHVATCHVTSSICLLSSSKLIIRHSAESLCSTATGVDGCGWLLVLHSVVSSFCCVLFDLFREDKFVL